MSDMPHQIREADSCSALLKVSMTKLQLNLDQESGVRQRQHSFETQDASIQPQPSGGLIVGPPAWIPYSWGWLRARESDPRLRLHQPGIDEMSRWIQLQVSWNFCDSQASETE